MKNQKILVELLLLQWLKWLDDLLLTGEKKYIAYTRRGCKEHSTDYIYIARVPWNVGRDRSDDLVSWIPCQGPVYIHSYFVYILCTVPGGGSMSVVFGKTILLFSSGRRKYNVRFYLWFKSSKKAYWKYNIINIM